MVLLTPLKGFYKKKEGRWASPRPQVGRGKRAFFLVVAARAAGLSITHNRYGVHNYILDGPVMELWTWLRGVTPRGYVLVIGYGAHLHDAVLRALPGLLVMEPWGTDASGARLC